VDTASARAPASTHGEAAVIEMQGIERVFTTDEIETLALCDVHLRVMEGEFLAVSGPSGSGKSTLLAIMGLLDRPTRGSYRLRGVETLSLSDAARAKLRSDAIGFVFQSFNLLGDLTVEDNVELPMRYAGVPQSERAERVRDALHRVGMEHRRKHHPAQLSGGQQQRVAVARAIVTRPAILLADEPTGNLDSNNGRAVMELLAGLHTAGSTICMVTHDPRYLGYAERRIDLFDGRIDGEHTSREVSA
jgi:putative ABC transport system ATP-binding protein